MKRKAAWCGLSFLTGTLLLCALDVSFLSLVTAAAALTVLAFLSLSEYRVYAAAVGISVLCGIFCGRAYTLFHIRPAVELSGEYITLEGEVTACRSYGSGYILTVDGTAADRRATVNFIASQPCEPYSIIRISGKAEALTDSGSFPSKSYYYPKGIYLQAAAESIEETGKYGSPLLRGISRFRDFTEECIMSSMEGEGAGLAAALICGDKTELSQLSKTKLYRAGIGHIFAVSGTHVMIVAMLFGLLFRLFLPFWYPRIIGLDLIVLAYMAFGGFSPSIVRAGIMFSLLSCSELFHRRTDVLSSLGVCAVVMCGMNPYICLSESFICSFGACIAIGVFTPPLTKKLRGKRLYPLYSVLIASCTVTVVLMPYMIFKFSEISLISPITNLLIVPLCTVALSLTVLAMLLGGATPPAQLIFKLAELLLNAALRLTDFFAGLSFSSIGCGLKWLLIPAASLLAAALVYTALKHLPKMFAAVTAGVLVVVWGVQSVSSLLSRETVRVKIFSTGQERCAVVSYGGACTLLDAGAGSKYIYSLQQYLSLNSLKQCSAVFAASEKAASPYLTELYPAPRHAYLVYGGTDEPFTKGMTADFGGYTVTRTEFGYDISTSSGTLSLTRYSARLYTDGEEYEVSADELSLEAAVRS